MITRIENKNHETTDTVERERERERERENLFN